MAIEIRLKYLCSSFSTPIAQQEVNQKGTYEVYGASGLVGYLDNYSCGKQYLGIVKDGAGVGRVNKYEKNSSLLGTMAYIVPNEGIDINWLMYVISALDLGKDVGKTTIPHIYFSNYGNKSVYYLPQPEQQKIAAYLDSECAKINDVITKTKATIEEYKKLKQSVITEAVTKGIRPNREMKDSGSVWFNNIPSDWDCQKLKFVFHIQKDIAGEEGYTVLSITQKGIIPKDLSKNEGQLAQNYSNYQFVHIGDFAMNHMDLLTGWVDISKYEGVTSPDYRVFVLNDTENNSRNYYLYMMQMCYSNKIFYGLGQGVSGFGRWRLQADKFLNFYIPIPPYEEQQEIADYLDKKCSEIDTLISKKEQIVTELESYKKSIIYEYVTGKKEVI